MKIAQAKNYKKPLYAIGVAAAVVTMAVTGCSNPAQLAGTTDIRTKETSYCKPDADNPVYSGEAVIMGEAELPEIDYIEETDPQDEGRVVLSGGVEIADPD